MKIHYGQVRKFLRVAVDVFHDRYLLMVLLISTFFFGRATTTVYASAIAGMFIGFFTGIAASEMRRARKLRRIVDSISNTLEISATFQRVEREKAPDTSVN